MNPADWLIAYPLIAISAGATLCLLFAAFTKNKNLPAYTTLLALAVALVLQAGIFHQAIDGPAFHNLYSNDSLSALLGCLFLILTILAWGYSLTFLKDDEPHGEYFALILASALGMFMMAGANHLIFLFLGVEILSIPLYMLCAFRRNEIAAVEGGLKYFLLGTFSAAFLLFGIALIYAGTGSFYLSTLVQQIPLLTSANSVLVTAGIGLVVVGLLFKASIAPFHFWTPDVYQGAATPVTALMAGGTKAAAFAAIVRVAVIFPQQIAPWLIAAALLTLFVGNLGALVQSNIKRLLAYSGIAHAGILLIAVVVLPRTASAYPALLFYLIAYGLTAVACFGIVSYLEKEDGSIMTELEGFKGLSRRRPYSAMAMTFLLLSLGGFPPTAGFFAKYLVFAAAIEAQYVALAVLGILFSVIALGYYLRVVVYMYMMPSAQDAPAPSPLPWYAIFASTSALIGVLAFGVQPSWLLNLLS